MSPRRLSGQPNPMPPAARASSSCRPASTHWRGRLVFAEHVPRSHDLGQSSGTAIRPDDSQGHHSRPLGRIPHLRGGTRFRHQRAGSADLPDVRPAAGDDAQRAVVRQSPAAARAEPGRVGRICREPRTQAARHEIPQRDHPGAGAQLPLDPSIGRISYQQHSGNANYHAQE